MFAAKNELALFGKINLGSMYLNQLQIKHPPPASKTAVFDAGGGWTLYVTYLYALMCYLKCRSYGTQKNHIHFRTPPAFYCLGYKPRGYKHIEAMNPEGVAFYSLGCKPQGHKQIENLNPEGVAQ